MSAEVFDAAEKLLTSNHDGANEVNSVDLHTINYDEFLTPQWHDGTSYLSKL